MPHINFQPYPDVEARTAPPEDYQRIQTNPREFGAQVGAGLEHLGEGVTKAGQLYGQIATDDQANHVLSGLDDINAKFRALQGKDRMDQWPVVQKQMTDLLAQGRNNLGTADQALDYDRQTRYLYSRAQREAGDLYDQSMKEWGTGVNKAAGDLALNGIQRGAADNDPAAIANHTEDLIHSRMKNAQLMYGNDLSPDMQQNIERGARADSTMASVESLATTDPVRAQQLLDAGRNNLLANQYQEASARLKQPIIDHQAQQLAFGTQSGGGNPTIAPQQVTQIAQANGVDPALANATAAIESGHGSKVGTRGDIYQMGTHERESVGGGPTPAATPEQQTTQGVQFLAQKQKELTTALGRTPTNSEIYLAHQQGTIGATALLTHPDEPAGQAVGNPEAIRVNGGDPNAPASQFTTMWQQRYQSTEQRYGGESAPPAYPYPSGQIQRIMSSDATPQVKEAAARNVELLWADQNHAHAQQQQQLKDASDGRENQILSSVAAGKPLVTATQALGDPALTPEARMRMSKFLENQPGSDIDKSAAAYGPGFWGAYKGITAAPGDPNRITDQGQLIDRAGPGGDLTLAGVQELSKTMASMKKPENAGDTKLQAGALAYAKHQLSFEADYGAFKVRDPKGEDQFNVGFLPAFMSYWQKGIAAGKTPEELVDRKSIDQLIAPYKRPPAEEMKDKLQAGDESLPSPTAKPDLTTPQGLIAAVRAGQIPREQGEAMALKNGWIRAAPAPPIVQ